MIFSSFKKNMKACFCTIICSLFFILSAASSSESKAELKSGLEEVLLDEKRMGVEIETSAVKIHSLSEHKVGFTITNATGQHWMMEEDTTDSTFAATHYEDYDKNLEFKTVGGFRKEEIIQVSRDIQSLLSYLHVHATPSLDVDADELKTLIGELCTKVVFEGKESGGVF